MIPAFENKEKLVDIFVRRSSHVGPHLHREIECVYVTSGTLEIGMGQKLFHMEQGDFAMIVPEMIHSYQCFSEGKNRSVYLLIAPELCGTFISTLDSSCPVDPVIPREKVHPDIPYALKRLQQTDQGALQLAFVTIILAQCLPLYEMVEKNTLTGQDMVYRMVSYISAHYREPVTLTGMAHDLGYSPYTMSRMITSTFHRNFNQYVNGVRLKAAETMLRYTDHSITDIALDAGFESQRTFNRVFREQYRLTPRQYRQQFAAENL